MSHVNKEKMDEIFGQLNGEDIVGILIHPAPDPDCLGAALGFSALLSKIYNVNSRIYYYGEISHPQNKSMKVTLNMNLIPGEEFSINDVAATVVLDTDLGHSGFKNDKLTKADVRIDHHFTDRNNGATFCDVRPVGSTCSIIWEYLSAFEVSLEEFPDVATAMILGISTDTLNFTTTNTSELDMEAFRAILPWVNKDDLAKVMRYDLPKQVFELEGKAFKNKTVVNTTLVSFIGHITAINRDIIPTIADRFVRMEGINTTVVLGILENCITASVRSNASGVDVNDLCIDVFGKGNAGGKSGSGGAKVPLGPAYTLLKEKELKEKVIAEVIERLQDKIFKALGDIKEDE